MKAIRLLMLGVPGVGKGTFSKKISIQHNLPIFVMGDAIRAKISEGTEFSKEVKAIVNSGKLIDDDLTLRIFLDANLGDNFLLDGFPRTIPQAEMLKANGLDLTLAINIKQHEDVVVAKILGRRVCSKCRENFNVAVISTPGYSLPPKNPKVPNICDNCGSKLIIRADDTEPIVRKRLEEYRLKTQPLEEYYRDRLLEFHSYRGIDDIPDLLAAVNQRLLVK